MHFKVECFLFLPTIRRGVHSRRQCNKISIKLNTFKEPLLVINNLITECSQAFNRR